MNENGKPSSNDCSCDRFWRNEKNTSSSFVSIAADADEELKLDASAIVWEG